LPGFYGLTSHALADGTMQQQLTALLAQHRFVKLAILFGSRAAGNARPNSDSDLAVLAVFKGQRLLGSTTLYAQLLSRHLIDSAGFLPLQQRLLKERRAAWLG
jgi:predicted nucleotidyltransferase